MLYHIHLRIKTGEYDKAFENDINFLNYIYLTLIKFLKYFKFTQ